MDKQHFDQLIKGVREMKRHLAGKVVRGMRTTELLEPISSNPQRSRPSVVSRSPRKADGREKCSNRRSKSDA